MKQLFIFLFIKSFLSFELWTSRKCYERTKDGKAK